MRRSLFLSTVLFTTVSIVSSSRIYAAPQSQARLTQQQSRHESSRLVEEFSFVLKDFKVDHQGQNIVNVNVRYRYKKNIALPEYPDFRLIAKDIENFLTNYPNETDYWEIVNKKITQLVLDKYGALVTVTCEITVSPTDSVPYLRTSTTTRAKSGSIRQR